MPKDLIVPVLNNPLQHHFDERPLTCVRDLSNAMNVEILTVEGISNSLLEFVNCGYNIKPTPYDAYEDQGFEKTLNDLVSGGTLWQGLEAIHFKVRVTGVTRIFTHQLVRQRIGITFSQQCSGEVDWRHADILVPRIHPTGQDAIIEAGLLGKYVYSKLVDSKKVSIQDARYVLPQCLETFIYFDCSLATAIAMYQKRICTQTNCWEMVAFARKFKAAILDKIPHLSVAFLDPCKKGKCWYNTAKQAGQNVFLYQPDEIHDNFQWNPQSFIYDSTHGVMSESYEAVKKRWYLAETPITESTYNGLATWL